MSSATQNLLIIYLSNVRANINAKAGRWIINCLSALNRISKQKCNTLFRTSFVINYPYVNISD